MKRFDALFSGLVALVIGYAVTRLVTSNLALSLMTQAVIMAVFALGVGVLLRQNGMVSFGHALYFGAASYIVALLLVTRTVSAELAIFIAVGALTAFAFVVGLVIVRVPGVAFGMLTLAIGQMAYLTASRSRGLTGGADGMSIEWPSTLFGISVAQLTKPAMLLFVCWSVLVLLLVGLAYLLRSRFGGVTELVRDNEERARFIGISTLLPRAAIYALSASVTSVAGVLAALNTGFISPESLHWSLSGVTLMMVVIGGTTRLWGAALGAGVYFLAKDFLGDFARHWMAIFGALLIVVIVFAPQGLSGLAERLWRRVVPGARRAAPFKAAASKAVPATGGGHG